VAAQQMLAGGGNPCTIGTLSRRPERFTRRFSKRSRFAPTQTAQCGCCSSVREKVTSSVLQSKYESYKKYVNSPETLTSARCCFLVSHEESGHQAPIRRTLHFSGSYRMEPSDAQLASDVLQKRYRSSPPAEGSPIRARSAQKLLRCEVGLALERRRGVRASPLSGRNGGLHETT
jgi:hypothetical protein